MKNSRNLAARIGRFWLAVLPLFVAACSPSGLRMEQSPLLRTLERKSGLIVYIGPDGNIYTMDQGGGRQKAVTTDAQIKPDEEGNSNFYQFPTWSPDSQRLAYVGLTSQGGSLGEVTLITSRPDGSDRVEAFQSDTELPFYLYWSPNSQHISFLTTEGGSSGLSLQLVHAQGGNATKLDMGDAIYWSWSPDNRNLLVHTGGAVETSPDSSLFLMNLGESMEKESLDFRPINFQAPAWSPDGEELLVAAKNENGQDGLYLTDSHGREKSLLTEVEGTIAFGWSPDGKRVAYLINNPEVSDPTARRMTIVDPDNPGEEKTIEDELIVAFFWSPDSRKIAYFVPSLVTSTEEVNQDGQPVTTLLLTLKVYDVRSGKSIQVAVFRPTQTFVNLLPFFDQYQHSVSLWSPDSRNLVLSAVDGQGNEGVFIIEAAANLQPRLLAEGEIGVWSWK